MGSKIKRSDLFDDNLFPTKDALDYAIAVEAATIGHDKLIEQKMKIAQSTNFIDSKSILEGTKAMKEGQLTLIASEKLKQAVIRTSNLEAAALKKVTKEQEKLKSEYDQANESLKKLEKRQLDNVIAGRELSKTGLLVANAHEQLRVKVEGAERGVGRFQRNVGNYSQELRKLQKELQQLEPGSKAFNDLAIKAGALKDKIGDAKDATKAFSSASKATQAKTLFGQIGNDLKDLNFTDAADKARQFASVVRSISFAEVISGIKNLGSALLDIGKALLLNPFTLLIAAVAAVAFAIYQYTQSLGDNTKAIEINNEAIKKLKDAHKDLRDEIDKSTQAELVASGKLSNADAKRNAAREKAEKTFAKLAEDRLANEKAISEELGIDDIRNIDSKIKARKELGRRMAEFNKEADKIERDAAILLQQEIGNINADAFREEQDRIKKENEKKTAIAIAASKKKSEEDKKLQDEESKKNFQNFGASQKKKDDLQAKIDAELALQKQYEIDGDRLMYEQKIEELRVFYHNKEIVDAEELAKAKAKRAEIARIEKEVTEAFKAGLEERQEKNSETIDEEIKRREDSIATQQNLAERGLANTLAFEKEQLAKAQLAKKEEAEKQRRQDEAIKLAEVFLNSLNSKLENDKPYAQAAGEALAETFAAKGLASVVAGSFFEGSEKVENDLNPSFAGRDGYLIRADGKERILTGDQNKLIGNMSNDELAQLAYDSRYLPNYMLGDVNPMAQNMSNSVMIHQLSGVISEIKELKEVMKNRPISRSDVDSQLNIREEIYKNGQRIVNTYMNPNRRKSL